MVVVGSLIQWLRDNLDLDLPPKKLPREFDLFLLSMVCSRVNGEKIPEGYYVV